MIVFFSGSNCGAAVIEDWVARYASPFDGAYQDDSRAQALAVDGYGNVYVTGYSAGAGTDYEDYLTIKYLSNGTVAPGWPQRYDGGIDDLDDAVAIAVDDSGNVYVTGNSYGAGTDKDIVTIKYLSTGDIATGWPQRYNGTSTVGFHHDGGNALVVDDSGNVYVTGYSDGDGAGEDIITIKYLLNGDIAAGWPQRYEGTFGGASEDRNQAKALVVDDLGNVYVTGYSYGDGTGYDMVTIKYLSNGNTAAGWPKSYHNFGDDKSMALAVDDSGNVYVTGRSESTGGATADDYLTIKYDPNGTVATGWPQRYNGTLTSAPGNDWPCAIAVDGAGNVYVTGWSYGEGTAAKDIVTIKYLSNGNTATGWPQRYNGPREDGDDVANDLTLDSSGNVYVTGTSGITSFNYFTIKYLPDGTVAADWPVNYDGPAANADMANAVKVDSNGNVYVTGWSWGGEIPYHRYYATVKYSQYKLLLQSEPPDQGVLHRHGPVWNDIHIYFSMKSGIEDVDCSSIQVFHPRHDGSPLPLSVGSGITDNSDGTCSVYFNMGGTGFPGENNSIPADQVSIDFLVKAASIAGDTTLEEGVSMSLAYVEAGEPAPLQLQVITLANGQIRLVGLGGQPFPGGGYSWALPCEEAEWPGGTSIDCGGLSPDPAGHPAEVTYTAGTDSGQYQVVMIDAYGARVERDLASFESIEVNIKTEDVLEAGAVCTAADQSGCLETKIRTVAGTTLVFDGKGVNGGVNFDWTITDDTGTAVASATGTKRIEHTFLTTGRYYVKAIIPQTLALAAATIQATDDDQAAVTEVFVGEADIKAIVVLASDGTGNQCVWGHILREVLETFRCAGLGDEDLKLFRPDAYSDMLECESAGFFLPYGGQYTDKADFLDMVENAYAADKLNIPAEKPTVLYIYLLGHGSENYFHITPSVTLAPGEFGGALDALQTARANIREVVVMDSCKSGSFMSGLVDAPNRIVITSASEGQNAYIGNDSNNGDRSFSHYFFRNHLLVGRKNLYEGWNSSSRAVADNPVTGTPSYQTPLYDDDGDEVHTPVATVGCPGGDGCEGMNTYLLNIEGCLNYRPVDVAIDTSMGTTLVASIPGNQTSDEPSRSVVEVLLAIIPPGAEVDANGTIPGMLEVFMDEDDDPGTLEVVEYSWDLSGLTAQGVYRLTVYGVYGDGIRSEVEHISYEVCTTGDMDCDGVPDGSDNCPDVVNPDQKDQDLDGFGTACECNDYEPAIYPGAPEICDGRDSDCNGVIPADEADDDGDGYGVCEGDCNDLNRNIYPLNSNSFCDCLEPNPQGAMEECAGGIDEDCDGQIDMADSDCTPARGWAANTVASAYGGSSLAASGVVNHLALLLFPVGAVVLLRTLRRKK